MSQRKYVSCQPAQTTLAMLIDGRPRRRLCDSPRQRTQTAIHRLSPVPLVHPAERTGDAGSIPAASTLSLTPWDFRKQLQKWGCFVVGRSLQPHASHQCARGLADPGLSVPVGLQSAWRSSSSSSRSGSISPLAANTSTPSAACTSSPSSGGGAVSAWIVIVRTQQKRGVRGQMYTPPPRSST